MHCIREPGQILSKIKPRTFWMRGYFHSRTLLIFLAIGMTLCTGGRRVVADILVVICRFRDRVFVATETGIG